MDPATIVGVVSAIISFIEFTGIIISTATKIYNAKDGTTDEIRKIDTAVKNYKNGPGIDRQTIADPIEQSSPALKDALKCLRYCQEECIRVATEIDALVNATTVASRDANKTHSRIWGRLSSNKSVIKASFITVWNREKINILRKQWEECIGRFNDASAR